MNTKSMLSAKHVRIHGFSDSRWTTNDQMLQYKGLIKLYNRDRKITDVDIDVAERKQKFEWKTLKKDIESSRNKLQGMIFGDKQERRNALAEHKRMQLAYQELPALQVIDHIYQNNFTKRKQLDMLNYKTRQCTKVLIDLKLHKALLEDRIKYQLLVIPEDKIAERITGKVQDAILKKEAAIVVHQAYLNIINIMKKDTLYYDAILEDLKKNGKSQAQCMIYATQLGQLAMEYLDDRKNEFKDLEKIVRIDMKKRVEDLKVVSQKLEDIQGNMRLLIRKDSDVNCGLVILPNEFSNKDLALQMEELEKVLSILEKITLVTNFNSIYYSLTEQMKQKHRLEELKQKKSMDYDALLNKLDHASTMKHMLENTMLDTTESYMKEKERISKELIAQRKRKKEVRKRAKVLNKLLADIDTSLKHFDLMCQIINDDTRKPLIQKDPVVLPNGGLLYREKCPDPGDFDGVKLIDMLLVKVRLLMSAAANKNIGVSKDFTMEEKTNALVAYGNLVSRNVRIIHAEHSLSEESLVEETSALDVTLVPTREEIKRISAAIYKECSIDPDLMPGPAKK